jgi:hypothetical protein
VSTEDREPVVEQVGANTLVKAGATGTIGDEEVSVASANASLHEETAEEKENDLILREDRDEKSEEEEDGKDVDVTDFKFKSARKDKGSANADRPSLAAAPADVEAAAATENDATGSATGSEEDGATGSEGSSATGAAAGSKCPNACSGNGECNEMTGECECKPTFQGPDCSLKSCGNCIHGHCAGDVCVCDIEHFGESCELRKCPGDCSGHGECLSVSDLAASAACDCADGWSGLDCATPDVDTRDASGQSGNGSTTKPDIDICNQRCADSCAGRSKGDTMIYVDCFRKCSEKCTGVELIKKEFRSREAPETPVKVEPATLPASTPSASVEPHAPRLDTEDDALPTNDAISEGQRATLGDYPPADKHDRLTIGSMKAAIDTTFSAVRGSQNEDPLVRCQRCQRTLLAEAGAAGESNLGTFLQGVCTKYTNGQQADECEAVRVKYRANMVHDAPNLESALGEFCTSFFDVPCE